ncbi:MAG: cytochrome c oxidase subunit II [Woeseiaceae bacterium]
MHCKLHGFLPIYATAPVALTACELQPSALAAAGSAAEQTLQLFWWMSAVAVLVWLFVIAAACYAARTTAPEPGSLRTAQRLIVFGGIILPVILLGTLLVAGLRQMPRMTAPGDGLVIDVTGERWWWRVRYEPLNGRAAITANEIRMPVDERVEFTLRSSDVIHSFWIPALGGKIDMIPGRVNRLVLDATRTGRYRGVCAEFCGLSHTLMEFDVIVMEPEQFAAWLVQQSEPAALPADPVAKRGQGLFLENGCGACHRISGTAANGRIGPDLSHVGARLHVAAGTLPAGADSFAHWIGHTTDIKAGALMPAYDMLNRAERRAIGVYLAGLR